jgi:hypothetical protein
MQVPLLHFPLPENRTEHALVEGALVVLHTPLLHTPVLHPSELLGQSLSLAQSMQRFVVEHVCKSVH